MNKLKMNEKPKGKYCGCEDWEPNIEKVNSLMCSAFNISHGLTGYNGKIFKYCPWCGKKLKNKE